jgi:hypothetical protein
MKIAVLRFKKAVLQIFATVILGGLMIVAGLLGHVAGKIITSLVFGPFVMVGFHFASSFSDGAVPALGYFASVAITFILTLPQRTQETMRKAT